MQEDVEDQLEQPLTHFRAPNTTMTYNRALEEFRTWRRGCPDADTVDELDAAAIFVAKKSVTNSSRSLATFVSSLAFSRMGRKPFETERWTVLDELVRAKKRVESVKDQKFASTEEWLTLLDTTSRMSWPIWRADRAAVLLTLLFCGLMRISEALNICREDVSSRDAVLEVHGKGNSRKAKSDQFSSGSAVFLAREDWFDEALERLLGEHQGQFLLAAANGGKWSPGAAASEIRRLCEEAGIRVLSPHTFRRGGATRAIENGIPVDKVQRRGRWANPTSMKPYLARTLLTQGGPTALTGPPQPI
ncbi:site-specific recombinase, phage integrase family [Oesophagostomum dentatum]|uniref:Site-specific recombinase, phage integrase family n=1 Tax=Oesophagostomum dentatum TaxID=61180 RepID=A0A0B1TJ32_OESDE|nr:site-specific recombinase, phage integrase family [Oesophagostomum dentatum]